MMPTTRLSKYTTISIKLLTLLPIIKILTVLVAPHPVNGGEPYLVGCKFALSKLL